MYTAGDVLRTLVGRPSIDNQVIQSFHSTPEEAQAEVDLREETCNKCFFHIARLCIKRTTVAKDGDGFVVNTNYRFPKNSDAHSVTGTVGSQTKGQLKRKGYKTQVINYDGIDFKPAPANKREEI